MIIFGVLVVLSGLADIIIPDQVKELYGLGETADYVNWMGALLGAAYIAAGFWIIIAGRDPLRHINWVKFVITWCILTVVINVYSITQGYVDFSQNGGSIIFDAVFAVVFLALYPWRAARSSE